MFSYSTALFLCYHNHFWRDLLENDFAQPVNLIVALSGDIFPAGIFSKSIYHFLA